LHEVVTYFRVW